MASLKQFRLPDVGEGLTEAEIVHWHVKVGDVVTQNQTIVDIETAKKMPGVKAVLVLATPGEAKVLYQGQEIAAVAAETEERARDAARAGGTRRPGPAGSDLQRPGLTWAARFSSSLPTRCASTRSA